MPDEPIKIRASLPRMRDRNGLQFSPEAFQSMVDQINEKAKQGGLLGQLESPGDARTRLNLVSHRVLPDARLNDDGSVSVSIEVLNTPMGRQLQAMLEHSPRRIQVSSRGILRGVGSCPEDILVSGVDLDFQFPTDWTALDGIVDALSEDESE